MVGNRQRQAMGRSARFVGNANPNRSKSKPKRPQTAKVRARHGRDGGHKPVQRKWTRRRPNSAISPRGNKMLGHAPTPSDMRDPRTKETIIDGLHSPRRRQNVNCGKSNIRGNQHFRRPVTACSTRPDGQTVQTVHARYPGGRPYSAHTYTYTRSKCISPGKANKDNEEGKTFQHDKGACKHKNRPLMEKHTKFTSSPVRPRPSSSAEVRLTVTGMEKKTKARKKNKQAEKMKNNWVRVSEPSTGASPPTPSHRLDQKTRQCHTVMFSKV